MYATTLFCIVGFVVSMLFSHIGKEVQQLTLSNDFINGLERCKKLHALTRNLVRQLNDCFGILLLFEICFFFVSIVNGCYGVTMNEYVYYAPFITYHLLQLSLICYVSHQIQTKVELITDSFIDETSVEDYADFLYRPVQSLYS